MVGGKWLLYKCSRHGICWRSKQHTYSRYFALSGSDYTGTFSRWHAPAQIDLHTRSAKTLDTIKNRLWKNNWPLVNERDQKITGPRILQPQEYHNQTLWPWATATEILARSRFNRIQECDILFSRLVSENRPTARHRGIPGIVNPRAYYEWINPLTDEGGGVFPFRTGISAVRIVIMEILERIRTSMMCRSTDPYTSPNQGQNVAKSI